MRYRFEGFRVLELGVLLDEARFEGSGFWYKGLLEEVQSLCTPHLTLQTPNPKPQDLMRNTLTLNQMPEDPRLKDRISDCEARAGCPKRSIANPRRARAGSPHPGGSWETGLIVPSPRSAVSIVRGEVDNMLCHVRDSTSRGLRVMVFDQAGEVKYEDTFDTWCSISESMRLSDMLGSLSSFECVAVTSFDAWEKCFTHHAANALGKCGIDGRRMLKQSEAAKLSWDGLVKRLGGDEPSDDARPDGHGHPVAAVGVKVRFKTSSSCAIFSAMRLAGRWSDSGLRN